MLQTIQTAYRPVFILFALLLLQGCAGIGSNKLITVSSEPQGAEVLADGKPVGRTPVQISQVQNFPPRWHGTSYTVKGKLEFRKPGCEPYTLEVNEGMLLKDIHVDLECAPGVGDGKVSGPKESGAGRTAPRGAAADVRDIEARLERLGALRDRGTISEEEYRRQRRRILDSL